MNHFSEPRPPTAVVIGGSLAGMLTAAALSSFYQVTIIERDILPDGPKSRRGLPQAHHAHLLWSGGANAISSLLPGVLHEILEDGACKVALPTNMVGLSPEGWFRRWRQGTHSVVLATRDYLDWYIRQEVQKLSAVRIIDNTELLGLVGDAERVTGVQVRGADEQVHTVDADLVVDTSGRGSRAPQWLAELGATPPAVRTVDPGLVYASRIYRIPKSLRPIFPVIVNVQADPRGDGPGQAATLIPVENDAWMVTLSGTRGGEPTNDPAEFEAFARGLRHPIIGKLISKTEPLTDVTVTRSTINRRHFYEKAKLPNGFLVLGDAVAAYNPVYGHGMSVAAQSAVALRETVRKLGPSAPDLTARAQKAIARPVSAAWALSTSNDVFYPDATENGPTTAEKLGAAYVRRLIRTSTGSEMVARAVTEVMTLERPAARLFTPPVVLATALGPRRKQLAGPPLNDYEVAAVAAL